MMSKELSKGFFYFMFSQQLPEGYQPVLQVVESKDVPTGGRFRMYDGLFRYSNCFIPHDKIIPSVFTAGTKIHVNKYDIVTTSANSRWYVNVIEYKIIEIADISYDFILINQENYQVHDQRIHEMGIRLDSSREPPFKRQRTTLNDSSRIYPASNNITPAKRYPNNTTNNINTTPRRINTSSVIPDNSITPISLLSPFVNKWKICGVCTNRESSRIVNGKKGQLKVFSFELADEKGDAIKITCWDDVVEKLDNVITIGETYYITGEGCVRSKNSRFNVTSHDFEISLNHNCVVEKAEDKRIAMPEFSIKRIRIADIPRYFQQDPSKSIDILAVVDKIGEPQNIFSAKKNVDLLKRDVVLVDDSNASVTFTLWEENAQDIPFTEAQTVGIKGLKVAEFNGGFTVGKNMNGAFRIEINPDLPEVTRLADWYPNRNVDGIISISSSSAGPINLESELRTLCVVDQANMADLSNDGKGVVFYNVGTIVDALKEGNITYPACVVCNKKVILSESGGFDCIKCGIHGGAQFKQRYILTIRISDVTGEVYLTLFDDQASELLGRTADEMDHLHKNDLEEYQNVFSAIMFKTFLFKVKVSSEFYNDKKRVKYSCLNLRHISHSSYSKVLEIAINKLERI